MPGGGSECVGLCLLGSQRIVQVAWGQVMKGPRGLAEALSLDGKGKTGLEQRRT